MQRAEQGRKTPGAKPRLPQANISKNKARLDWLETNGGKNKTKRRIDDSGSEEPQPLFWSLAGQPPSHELKPPALLIWRSRLWALFDLPANSSLKVPSVYHCPRSLGPLLCLFTPCATSYGQQTTSRQGNLVSLRQILLLLLTDCL